MTVNNEKQPETPPPTPPRIWPHKWGGYVSLGLVPMLLFSAIWEWISGVPVRIFVDWNIWT